MTWIRSRWVRAVLVIVGVLLLNNWRLLIGTVAPQWDAADFFGPEFSLVADHAKAGRLLLWNPWTAGGTPDLAEPEMGVTSPLMLVVGLLSPNPQAGFVFYWLVIWIFGAVGMLLFSRHLRAPVWGALVVALGFAVCGFYTGHAEHTSSLYSFSFVAWVVWRLDTALLTRRSWPAAQAGVLYGLSALGGYPQLTILTGLLLAFWCIGRVFLTDSSNPEPGAIKRLRPLAAAKYLLIAGLIGTAILSPIYVGFMTHTSGYSDRVGPRPRDLAITSNRYLAPAFTTVSSPYLALLNMQPNPIWPEMDISFTSVYMGVSVLFFATWALRRRNGWRWYLAGVLIFFCCCSVGKALPIRGWLYDLVLPTRYFRNAALFRCYVIFLFATLAAAGTRDLEECIGRQRTRFFGLAAGVLAYAGIVVFAGTAHQTDKRLPQYPLAVLHATIVWVGLAAIAISIQRRAITRRAIARSFVALAIIDAALTLTISGPTLYTSASLDWWHAVNRLHHASLILPNLDRQLQAPAIVATYPNDRNVPLRVSTLQSYVTMSNRYDEQLAGDPELREMALGPNRIWFSPNPVFSPVSDPAYALFSAQIHQFGVPVLMLHVPEQMSYLSRPIGDPHRSAPAPDVRRIAAATCSPAVISDWRYQPNSLDFSYRATEPGWLLITDRWAPGWRVNVNGREQPNVAADFIYRGVHVDAGVNVIRYAYKPAGFWPLTALSWATLLIYASIECFMRRVSTGSVGRLLPK